jgi:hypothetical protein
MSKKVLGSEVVEQHYTACYSNAINCVHQMASFYSLRPILLDCFLKKFCPVLDR